MLTQYKIKETALRFASFDSFLSLVCVCDHLASVLWCFEEQGIDEGDGICLDLLIGPAGLIVHTHS